MTVQTSYEKNLAVALPGLIYDMGNTDIDSFAAEAVIPFGTFVRRGTDSQNQVLLGGAAAIGVAVRTVGENDYPNSAFDGGEYAIAETVGVMREGYIWAQFDAAGGTVGSTVTINADGTVDAAGAATALTSIKAIIEKPAVDATIGTTSVFVGLVKVYAN